MVLSVTAGVQIGSWTNYQLGSMTEAPLSPPYPIIWPSYEMCGKLCVSVIEYSFRSFTEKFQVNLVCP